MKYLAGAFIALILYSCSSSRVGTSSASSSYEDKLSKYKKYEGYFDFYWSEKEGKIYLEVENLDEEFLYVNYLAAGVGSNDIGLDRGQIGDTRIVKFVRSGPKLLMIQPNYGYRAISDNEEEVRSVDEAFAQSVLFGFKIEEEKNGKMLIDISDMLISDAHGVSQRLRGSGEGSYAKDESKSAVYLPRTKNFVDNSEFEATITFKGTPSGHYLRTVAPTSELITVRMHHSLVKLPDNDYEPRKFDPRSGFYPMTYQDYATSIEEDLVKRFIRRHRLEKKDPNAEVSEAVEPIIYYVDKGAPEPIKSALIEGAQWWNQAFEAAGYKDAFQVYVLPDSADALDVRYNVIQWVHRSTRGWSYGSSVTDPRTGEIIKGHVSLGSLRVRQDFLIATGLLQPYVGEEIPDGMMDMTLARLRQLSAHEVGHTLGLYHNFAASTNDRASVMDYPHPYIQLDAQGNIDLSEAYDIGIGEWDKYAIRFGYSDFSEDTDEAEALDAIVDEWIENGLHYINDSDARPQGSAHALAHLWDNGENAANELNRLSNVRSKILTSFSDKAIRAGQPISTIEEVLVPMYFLHRFQIEAASKMVAGSNYAYKTKGDKLPYPTPVSAELQKLAIQSLVSTLKPDFLDIPESLQVMLSPKPPGYGRTRESFKSNTGVMFDPVAAAETSADMTLTMIFNADRIERLIQQNLKDGNQPGWTGLMKSIYSEIWDASYTSGLKKEIKMVVEKRLLYHLMNMAASSSATESTKAVAFNELKTLTKKISSKRTSDPLIQAHYAHTLQQFDAFLEEPSAFKIPEALNPPDGSPIGMDCAME